MKYWLCEFQETSGEFDYKHHHIYSDKNFEQLNFKGEDDDHLLVSHFFCDEIDKSNDCGGGYWTSDGTRILTYMGLQEVKKSELKILQKAKIYWEGEEIQT
jgi:hypothetical protein